MRGLAPHRQIGSGCKAEHLAVLMSLFAGFDGLVQDLTTVLAGLTQVVRHKLRRGVMARDQTPEPPSMTIETDMEATTAMVLRYWR